MSLTPQEFLPPTSPDPHANFMREALREALAAYKEGEVPVGAVIAFEGRVIARAHNQRETLQDPTAHAEILAITQAASQLESWRLEGTALYVTLEPCPMCAGAIVNARIPALYFGAPDPKAGAVETLYRLASDPRLNHRAAVAGGLYAERSSALLSRFFAERRLGPGAPRHDGPAR